MIYDVVICVAPKHNHIALMAIQSIYLFAQPRNIFIITPRSNFSLLEKYIDRCIPKILLNENNLFEKLNLSFIQDILKIRTGSDLRVNWYFQQFLKMSMCKYDDIADYFLIWDSDTILLKNLNFFDEHGKVLINPRKSHHKPYFYLIKKLFDFEKQVPYSFISEHFMVNKKYMRELIDYLISTTPGSMTWPEYILNSIDDKYLGKSGFSEYETYGNFIARHHKDSFKCRPIKSIRIGTKLFGNTPDKYNIFSLMLLDYAYVSFENWHGQNICRIYINKIISRLLFGAYQLLNLNTEQLTKAKQITYFYPKVFESL